VVVTFGFALPVFAGSGGAHGRTPLYDRLDVASVGAAIVEAEALGYDSVWVADHFLTGRDSAILEGWTTMAWTASLAPGLRVGSIHLANRFRHPALTAKMAATLDHVSGGRLDFFFEAGTPGSRREVEAYGYEFPGHTARMEAFEEAVQLIKAMWTQERPSFSGRHYSVSDAYCYPRPVQKPHPPVWIGTLGGEQPGAKPDTAAPVLDVIARQADGWNNTPAGVSYCRAMLQGLRAACVRNGRDFASLNLSLETELLIGPTPGHVARLKDLISRRNPGSPQFKDWDRLGEPYIIGTAQEVGDRVQQYVDLGIQTFQVWFMDYPSLDGLRQFAREVMPRFRPAGAVAGAAKTVGPARQARRRTT
jgi:alkanesulfonate monooxygenase SsuD/methylene tetrahydromethanopterin reductase-like flavin-dependent oxidoreductase (luciferase family)